MTEIKKEMNYDKCLGSWVNPYKYTKGIQSFEIYQREGKIFMKIFGKEGGIQPGNWGESELSGYARSPAENQAAAFKSSFDLDFAEVSLAINENKGLLVILAYISPKTDNNQSDYFIREFYHKK